MYVRASKWLKAAYCICLAAPVLPSGLFSISSWIGPATGGGGMLAAGGAGLLVAFALLLYRIVTVVRLTPSLDAYVTSRAQRALRVIGIAGMAVGIVGAVAHLLLQPFVLGLAGRPGDAKVAFFVVGLHASLASIVGLPALLLFELSRTVGFESKLHERLERARER
jgi:hypothetical protein